MKNVKLWRLISSVCLVLALLSGCKTAPKTPKTYTFFPPAPDEPRLQYLTSFSSEAFFGHKWSFSDFIVGERKPIDPLVKPYGLAIHDGKIFVCDTVQYVIQMFDFQKNRSFVFDPTGEGKMYLPINLAIDGDGTRYVADRGRDQILVFANDGTFLSALGKKDEMQPTDVAIAGDRLYVTDLTNRVVRVYGKADHKLLFTVPRDAKAAEGKLYQPTNLAIDQEGGRLLVSDTGAFLVQVYDLEGKFIRTIGKQGVAPGLFALPKGVAVDRQGHIYVVDARTQVVQIFDYEGRLLLFFGQPGASGRGELILPASVKVDYDNVKYFQKYAAPGKQLDYLVLVTSQFGPQKVTVYGFLKQK